MEKNLLLSLSSYDGASITSSDSKPEIPVGQDLASWLGTNPVAIQ
jgi:hypothetical protein